MAEAWTNKRGIKRLSYLKLTTPDPPASVVHDAAHSVAEHLEQLNIFAAQTIDPELLEDRKVLRRQYVSCAQDLPAWMTLMALDDLNTWSTCDPQ